ncbi:hypothetical protein PENSPDRAFT_318090 [Peniophora sp. CONT]|nr:hypothetical protein PENSPDRAFT_318090 [Peniophora sp. CONT]
MQDMIMNAHLSYMAERTFVMYNYTWDVGVGDYSKWGDSIIPAQIPISVYAKGPIAGAPYPADKYRQPAVSVPFFRSICPHPTMLNVDNIKHEIGEPSALTIMTHFANRLKSIDDGCVEFQYNTGQVLDFYIMGDGKRMADLWPPLLESPILTEWQWSDTITAALESNYRIVHPGAGIRDSQRAELPGLLALHVRRGDFEDHCKHLAKWKSAYNAFNTREGFPDQYTPPQNGEWGEASPEGLEFYGKHCFPSTKDIVEKVYQVRADAKRQGRNLDRIYVLTNGKSDWFAELKAALNELGGWKSIHSSRELRLTREQKYVAQAIDMLIATRADTFVGNAWSSLTSNVNMLRVVQHHHPQTSRFW